jgi:5-methylcytosine-specific restriction enzyme subunit McrC
LNKHKKHITVFEHECLWVHKGTQRLSIDELKAFEDYYGDNGVPYFSLIHNGIRFNEYVGAIQVGQTLIEILPKADKVAHGENEESVWRSILINMLRAVGAFDIHSTSSAYLKIKANSILDLYFELFVNEVEYLLHNGLAKKYRKKEGNVTALKGNLQFGKHIQLNLTHQERFYVRHTVYDIEHTLHAILYKTIQLLSRINTNALLHGRIGALLLHFPEMPEIKVTEATFNKIEFTRKTNTYKKAIEISRLLLLQYHPDISKGNNHILALMFDMNMLWEKFVYASLKIHKETAITVTAQTSKLFWQPESGYRSKIRPDIVINKGKPNCVVIDTKWKNLNGYNPSPDDLRQMYVYHEYYGAKRAALVYPGSVSAKSSGTYLDPKTSAELEKECSVISLSVEPNIKEWQKNIYNDFVRWMNLS